MGLLTRESRGRRPLGGTAACVGVSLVLSAAVAVWFLLNTPAASVAEPAGPHPTQVIQGQLIHHAPPDKATVEEKKEQAEFWSKAQEARTALHVRLAEARTRPAIQSVTQAETALTKKPVLHPWRAHADGESAIQHTAEEVSGMKRPWAVHRKLPPAEALPEDEPVEEEPEVGDQEDAEETGKHTEQAEGIEAAQAEAQDEQEDVLITQPAGRTTRSTAVNTVASLNARSLGNAPLPEPKEHGKTMAQMAALAKPIVVGSTPGADQDDFLKVMEDPELHPNTEVPLSSQCRALLQAPSGKEIPEYDESFQRIKSLIMCGAPMALAKIDTEQALLQGRDYLIRKHTGVQYALPLFTHETSYQLLRMDLLAAMQVHEPNYYFAVPVPPCVEGYEEEAHEAGGNVDRLVTAVGNLDPKFQPAYLTYATLWTRRHYDESRAFFEGLLNGPDSGRVYVMAFDQLTHNLKTLPWMERVVHVPADSIQNWAARQASVLAEARSLAEGAEAPSIFLFNLGPLSPIVIFHMHQANPQNLYIDVDGVLDALLSGRQRHEPAHYTGLPSEKSKLYEARQVCSQTRWSREGDCVAPKTVPRALNLKPGLSDLCFQKGAHGKPLKGRVSYFPDDEADGATLKHGYFPKTVPELMRNHGLHSRKAGPSIGQQIAG